MLLVNFCKLTIKPSGNKFLIMTKYAAIYSSSRLTDSLTWHCHYGTLWFRYQKPPSVTNFNTYWKYLSNLISNGLVVMTLDSQSRCPVFKSTGCLQGRLSLFILPRSIKWVPGVCGNLMVKSKLPPWSGSSLEAVEPHP